MVFRSLRPLPALFTATHTQPGKDTGHQGATQVPALLQGFASF